MTLPVIASPKYTMTLPYTKKTVEYRPYVIKEEKLLIMANESEDLDHLLKTVGDIVYACTFGKIDITKDPMFDVQYAFLNIRGKSQGENIEFFSICSTCNKKYPSTLHIDRFNLVRNPSHTHVVDLGTGIKVEMRYPTFQHFIALFHTEDESAVFDVVSECLDKIYTEEEVFDASLATAQERTDFVESLTPEQFEKLELFFATMPVLQYSTTFRCECGQENRVVIDGVKNFFA